MRRSNLNARRVSRTQATKREPLRHDAPGPTAHVGRFFLNSYQPLIMNAAGRRAIEQYHICPFVDHSCRREPDFELAYPSITALCRPPFARKLCKGDTVAYVTKKGSYLGASPTHWRLTAVLKVIERFESHHEAAEWYLGQGLRLPYNCLARRNPPLPLDQTAATWPSLEEWDDEYHARASSDGAFLASEPLFLELKTPPLITDKTMEQVFGRVPGTQNPPEITKEEYKAFLRLVLGRT